MSNTKGLRRALSPKRSLRLETQGSEGSGLNRLSFTASRKRTRKQSKLQTTGVAQDLDPQAFFEEWKITPQEEVSISSCICKPICKLQMQQLHFVKAASNCKLLLLQEKRLAELRASLDKDGVLRPQFGELKL